VTDTQFKCSACSGVRFTTRERAEAHMTKRHVNGALYVHHGIEVWNAQSTDGKYTSICIKHGFSVDVMSKAQAMSIRPLDICDVCRGQSPWCYTCDSEGSAYGACEDQGHDVRFDRLETK
jgi:hypothetical protein